jgi:RecJ-like exonuclease
MFCPKCSQQQIFDNVRFCSRCGFQLNIVKAILADECGSEIVSEAIAHDRSRRKKDMMLGAVLMGVFALHTAWTTEDLSLEGKFTGVVFKCFLLCVLINIIPWIRNLFSAKMTRGGSSSTEIFSRFTGKFKSENQNAALTAAANARPVGDYFTNRGATAELVAPPSITEDTTNLLRNN